MDTGRRKGRCRGPKAGFATVLEEWKQWGRDGVGGGEGGMSYSFPSFRPLVFMGLPVPRFSGKPCLGRLGE